jgi:hypothetical protein
MTKHARITLAISAFSVALAAAWLLFPVGRRTPLPPRVAHSMEVAKRPASQGRSVPRLEERAVAEQRDGERRRIQAEANRASNAGPAGTLRPEALYAAYASAACACDDFTCLRLVEETYMQKLRGVDVKSGDRKILDEHLRAASACKAKVHARHQPPQKPYEEAKREQDAIFEAAMERLRKEPGGVLPETASP